ncbi:hypothetical protein KP509_26G008600 [Ceratopteris richardii]|uniref:Uncharacterized protein n=1 Tax=Ceratopteris richardii TaxID=49495 RepID=A0A8T2RI70_CERRI|nr:hypothetical protein KP509_26G008600 [Ceratopteris richardii]
MLFRLYEFIEPRDKYDRLHKCLSLSDLALAKVSLFLSFAERPTNVTIAAAMCAQIQAESCTEEASATISLTV